MNALPEMTEATRSLLLKLRKGATASFETKQWQAVLVELGFEVVITKVRNTVVQFTVKKNGEKLCEINKEPRYRRIVFYDLLRALTAAKMDPRLLACEALGMDTPEVEAKLKELYVRDLTNTGTCPVCEGNFKRDGATKMVHHGYQRPGDGYIHGDCFAVGYRCWEESPEGAMAYVQLALRPFLAQQEITLAALKSGEVTEFTDKEYQWVAVPPSTVPNRQVKVDVKVTRESNEYRFEQMLADAIRQTERKIEWAKDDIERFAKRIDAWKPDVLPEVKHAGKFKVA